MRVNECVRKVESIEAKESEESQVWEREKNLRRKKE